MKISAKVKNIKIKVGGKIELAAKGGEGSGNIGHRGRPGKVGGSGEGGPTTPSTAKQPATKKPATKKGGLNVGDTFVLDGRTGTITRENDIGSIFVKYDDGDVNWIPRKKIARKIAEQSDAKTTAPQKSDIDNRFADVVRNGRPVRLYHSTPKEFLASIKEQGILANDAINSKDVDEGVYFTSTKESGFTYAGGFEHSAVIEFSIPKSEYDKVVYDDYDSKVYGAQHSYIISRNIPPEWITGVYISSDWGDDIGPFIKSKEGTRTGYMVVVFEDKSKPTIQPVRVDQAKKIDERWSAVSSGSGGMLIYHGTSAKIADIISKEGLRAFDGEDRPPSVYFAIDYGTAQEYGEGSPSDFETYAIVEFVIPQSSHADVKFDKVDCNMFGQENDYRIEGDIPRDWIRRIEVYDMDGDVLRRAKEFTGGTCYAVVFIDSPKETNNDNENQSQEERQC